MANKIQQRRGLKANMPTGSAGELLYATDTRELFIGTGNGNVNMGGSHWYRGTAMSGMSATVNAHSYSACPEVKVDDMYMNTSSGNIYACTTAGKGTNAKWTYQGCMKGPQGATGDKGETGQNLQAVYSIIPTQVGTWINGNAIYRFAFQGETSSLSKITSGTYSGKYSLSLYNLISTVCSSVQVDVDYAGIINYTIHAYAGSLLLDNKKTVTETNSANIYIDGAAEHYYGYIEFYSKD